MNENEQYQKLLQHICNAMEDILRDIRRMPAVTWIPLEGDNDDRH